MSGLTGEMVRPILPRSTFGTPLSSLIDVAAPLVGGRVEHVRIARVHGDLVDARVFADREHGVPCLPAVGCLVETAVAAGRPERPLRGDVDHVRVARIDQDTADVLGALEPHVLPRLAAVVRSVDAVAVGDAALAVELARADPDGRRV